MITRTPNQHTIHSGPSGTSARSPSLRKENRFRDIFKRHQTLCCQEAGQGKLTGGRVSTASDRMTSIAYDPMTAVGEPVLLKLLCNFYLSSAETSVIDTGTSML